MREVVAKVRRGGKVLGEFKISEAENWGDCQRLAGGEAKAVALFNAAYRVQEMGKIRDTHGIDPLTAAKRQIASLLKGASAEELAKIAAKLGVKV